MLAERLAKRDAERQSAREAKLALPSALSHGAVSSVPCPGMMGIKDALRWSTLLRAA